MIVLGAGGHASVVIAAARAAGLEIEAAYDDRPDRQGKQILGVPIAGTLADSLRVRGAPAVVAVGDNAARRSIALRLDHNWVTLTHPRAWIDPSVRLGSGAVIFAGAVVQPGAVIGAHCIVNTCASIDHDCVIGDYAHLAPGVHLAGDVTIGEGAFLGIGAAVIPRVSVGEWTSVGAGGIVVDSLPDRVLAVGVPARILRSCEHSVPERP